MALNNVCVRVRLDEIHQNRTTPLVYPARRKAVYQIHKHGKLDLPRHKNDDAPVYKKSHLQAFTHVFVLLQTLRDERKLEIGDEELC